MKKPKTITIYWDIYCLFMFALGRDVRVQKSGEIWLLAKGQPTLKFFPIKTRPRRKREVR